MLMKGLSEDKFLIMYHGGLMPERGIEGLIYTLTLNEGVYLFLLGNGTANYIADLNELAKREGVRDRVCIHDAVDHNELWKYAGAADVGMITIRASWKSYYYMLPNKLFENIQAETPVICSNFPAVQKMVKTYQVGLTCDPEKTEDINRCIMRFKSDDKFYRDCMIHIREAKKELCWEREKEVLKDAYRRIL